MCITLCTSPYYQQRQHPQDHSLLKPGSPEARSKRGWILARAGTDFCVSAPPSGPTRAQSRSNSSPLGPRGQRGTLHPPQDLMGYTHRLASLVMGSGWAGWLAGGLEGDLGDDEPPERLLPVHKPRSAGGLAQQQGNTSAAATLACCACTACKQPPSTSLGGSLRVLQSRNDARVRVHG